MNGGTYTKGVAVKLGRLAIVGFLLAMLIVPGFVSTARAKEVKEPVRRHCFSTNPILLMFTWYNAEYAFRVSNNSTIGIAGSYITLDDEDTGEDTYMSANIFYRYYPQGDAFTGFFFGARFGLNHIEVEVSEDTGEADEGTAYSFGIDIGYDWLLGESRMFYISAGIGAVRLFGGDLEGTAGTLPTVRLVQIGVAF
jgi:hypothetical protein